ncbi:MAG: trypsin-like peptidase domain-containing protein [Streptomycetaceae bacterium]|nr:trypsin-like peptidase domain-containing protein [Streptomycetaceae bacterium]
MPPVPPPPAAPPTPPAQPSAFSSPPPPTAGPVGGAGDAASGPRYSDDPYAINPTPAPTSYPEQDKPKRVGGLIAAVTAAALVAGGIGGGIGYWAADRFNGGSTTISAGVNPKDLNRAPTSVAGIAKKALPSVVTIQSAGCQDGGTGSGFVFDTQGHIITNNHVIASAAEGCKLTATFSDGKQANAQVVGHAQGYDVAVIKLQNTGSETLTPLPLGNSDAVVVGDPTVAIGAPFGLPGTVTSGIISAKNRPVASSEGQGSAASYMSALQTDASINPGNSGGPLLDGSGNVIGINSAIQSSNSGGSEPFGGSSQGGSIGLGFAIPINEAKWVAQTLIKTGQPVYAIMGMTVNMGYRGQGAQIAPNGFNGGSSVVSGGPADKAGLKPGDVITKLDDTVIDSGPTLIGTIWQHHPGDQVQVTYQRDGQTSTTTVTLGERKGDNS